MGRTHLAFVGFVQFDCFRTAHIHRYQILSSLNFSSRVSPQSFKTRLLEEGFHTIIKSVLFSSQLTWTSRTLHYIIIIIFFFYELSKFSVCSIILSSFVMFENWSLFPNMWYQVHQDLRLYRNERNPEYTIARKNLKELKVAACT